MSASAHTPFMVRQIAKPTDSEIDQISTILAAAFEKDEFSAVVTGRDPSLLGPFNKCQVVAASIAGEVYVAEDHASNILGAAVWFGPGRKLFDSDDQKTLALIPFFSQLTPELQQWWTTGFLPDYGQLIEHVIGPHVQAGSWYLQDIGIKPVYQHRGIATALIQHVRAKALKDRVPLCLEAATERNVSIYERLGFVMQGHGEISGPYGRFTFWCMLDDTTAGAPA